VRDKPAPFCARITAARFPISSAEGLALMRLAEALLRVPDAETATLTADQLGRADFAGDGDGSPHRLLAALSSSAIGLAKRWLPDVGEPPGLLERLREDGGRHRARDPAAGSHSCSAATSTRR
jgi:RHH-type proline utilization regulon transcriptional repressor/proline dehydrogenase/delta 1-pyrroline-5-carboxylate dehydrogenase